MLFTKFFKLPEYFIRVVFPNQKICQKKGCHILILNFIFLGKCIEKNDK